MHHLGVDLLEHSPEVLRLAADALADMPLWRPAGHSFEPLAELVVALVDVSLLHPTELPAHERKIDAAVRYGEQRRDEGLTEQFIMAEFTALREGLRRYLALCERPRPLVREALIRLDMAQTVAEQAALRGFHRPAIQQAGLWDRLVGRLARESPLLRLPSPPEG